MAAVGKGPHFLQKNPPAEISGYGPVSDALQSDISISISRECDSTECRLRYISSKQKHKIIN